MRITPDSAIIVDNSDSRSSSDNTDDSEDETIYGKKGNLNLELEGV